jgi:hypothetical protein
MHFVFLVEDQSGKKALDILVPKIIGAEHTFTVHPYRGIGQIPKDMKNTADPKKRILLNNLPRLLQGFGKTSLGRGPSYKEAIIVICDLDRRCRKEFREELLTLLNACSPKPETRFCIAVEEGEAWLLGDLDAVRAAYPNAKEKILAAYKNDEICGTWETLADSVHAKGAAALKQLGWMAVGEEKSRWASQIAPHMDVDKNNSPSFQYFRDKLRNLATTA